jgi:hypothetical protein
VNKKDVMDVLMEKEKIDAKNAKALLFVNI